jgi:hypothetical protein
MSEPRIAAELFTLLASGGTLRVPNDGRWFTNVNVGIVEQLQRCRRYFPNIRELAA